MVNYHLNTKSPNKSNFSPKHDIKASTNIRKINYEDFIDVLNKEDKNLISLSNRTIKAYFNLNKPIRNNLNIKSSYDSNKSPKYKNHFNRPLSVDYNNYDNNQVINKQIIKPFIESTNSNNFNNKLADKDKNKNIDFMNALKNTQKKEKLDFNPNLSDTNIPNISLSGNIDSKLNERNILFFESPLMKNKLFQETELKNNSLKDTKELPMNDKKDILSIVSFFNNSSEYKPTISSTCVLPNLLTQNNLNNLNINSNINTIPNTYNNSNSINTNLNTIENLILNTNLNNNFIPEKIVNSSTNALLSKNNDAYINNNNIAEKFFDEGLIFL